MGEATQATQSLPDGVGAEDGEEEVPREKVWGRLISLNPVYPNVELTGIAVLHSSFPYPHFFNSPPFPFPFPFFLPYFIVLFSCRV